MRTLEADGLAAAVLLALLGTAGIFYVNIMPALVAGLQTGLGFTARQAGFVGACNTYGAALGALTAALLAGRMAWRSAARRVLLGLIVIDAVSTAIHAPAPLMAVRLLQGMLGGFLVGVAVSVMARTRSPDRTFGTLLFVQFALGGTGIIVLPRLVPTLGTPVLFIALIALSALALAALPLLPAYAVPGSRGDRRARDSSARDLSALDPSALDLSARGASAPAARRDGRALFDAALLGALAGLLLFQVFMMSTSAFSIGMGESFALPEAYVTTTLGVGTWLGLIGAAAVIGLDVRHGRFVPIVAGISLGVLCNLALIAWGRIPSVWFTANALGSVVWAFVVPYLYGLTAAFDPAGRTAPWAGFASKVGLATGPAVGALVLRETHFIRLLWAASLFGVVAIVIAAMPARRLDARASRSEAGRTKAGQTEAARAEARS